MITREREQRLFGKSKSTGLFSVAEKPFRKSWQYWVEEWWKWCYFDPYGISPASDTTGKSCAKGQTNEDVWFLGGTFGGRAVRTCEVPKNRAIFFPIINDIISFYTDPDLKTEHDLHDYASADLDHTSVLSVRVDGFEIQDLFSYRIHSSLFEIVLPPSGNESTPRKTQAVSDGYWIFLKPLPRGVHELEFSGQKLEFDRFKEDNFVLTELPKFSVDVKYHLHVQ